MHMEALFTAWVPRETCYPFYWISLWSKFDREINVKILIDNSWCKSIVYILHALDINISKIIQVFIAFSSLVGSFIVLSFRFTRREKSCNIINGDGFDKESCIINHIHIHQLNPLWFNVYFDLHWFDGQNIVCGASFNDTYILKL